MARLLRFAAVAVLVGGASALLSGCTGDADPVVSVSPSVTAEVTPTPSVSPSPTPLSEEELLELIPENAREENFGSAVNFASFFANEYQRVFTRRDPSLFLALSGPDCKFCQSALSSFEELETDGLHREGGDISIDLDTAVGGLQDDGTYSVTFQMSTAPTKTLDANGVVVAETNGGTGLVGFSLTHMDEHWRVLGVNSEPAGE